MSALIHKPRSVGLTCLGMCVRSPTVRSWVPGELVMAESEASVRGQYGHVRVELVNVLSCHPPLAEYRVWPAEFCAGQNSAGQHQHPLISTLHDSNWGLNENFNALIRHFGPVTIGQIVDALGKFIVRPHGKVVVTSVQSDISIIYTDLVD